MKLIKLKLQGPFQGLGRGPSNVFTWSYVLVKFAKVRYFNHNHFSLLSLPTVSSHPNFPSVTLPIISGGIGVAAGMLNVDNGKLSWGYIY